MNGTTVQAISSPECPWIGGPSERSPSLTRNFHEYMSTAATPENTKIAIPVMNQKVKAMRSASLLASTGSHGTPTATAVVMAAATIANNPSWRKDARRTGGNLTR